MQWLQLNRILFKIWVKRAQTSHLKLPVPAHWKDVNRRWWWFCSGVTWFGFRNGKDPWFEYWATRQKNLRHWVSQPAQLYPGIPCSIPEGAGSFIPRQPPVFQTRTAGSIQGSGLWSAISDGMSRKEFIGRFPGLHIAHWPSWTVRGQYFLD